MDVLSDVLDVMHLRGTLYFRTDFAPPFSVAVPELGRAARFHIVAEGRCHVRVAGGEDVELNTGDCILVPNGRAHILSDAPGREPETLDEVVARSGYDGNGVLVYGGAPDRPGSTKLICGHFTFAEGAEHPLLNALPDHLLVTAELRTAAPWLDELLGLIVRQMFSGVPGMKASVIRLSEALFIEVIRSCADQNESLCNIVRAMGDTPVGKSLAVLHRNPERPWTLAGLAREVGMSRSRFADRFHNTMGCTPMNYLADLRMHRARNMLADTGTPIQIVAAQVGYRSPAALSRAFSERFGLSPREARHAAS